MKWSVITFVIKVKNKNECNVKYRLFNSSVSIFFVVPVISMGFQLWLGFEEVSRLAYLNGSAGSLGLELRR